MSDDVIQDLAFRRIFVGLAFFLAPSASLRSAPPSEFVPEQDFILAAAEAGFNDTLKDFEISEPLERDLVLAAIHGKAKGESVLSIALVRPGKDAENTKKAFEKSFGEQFTLRLTKGKSTNVKGPIAIINLSTHFNGRLSIEERILVWDGKQWSEVSGSAKPHPQGKE